MTEVGYDDRIHFIGRGIGQVPPQRGVNSEAKTYSEYQKKRKPVEHDLSPEGPSREADPGLFEHDLEGIDLLQQIFPGENGDELRRIHLNNLNKKIRKATKEDN